MTQPRLKHFGWGREGEGLTPDEEAFVLGRIEQRFGPLAEGGVKPPRLDDLKLESVNTCALLVSDCEQRRIVLSLLQPLGRNSPKLRGTNSRWKAASELG